jgi:hypothetical protein
MAEPARERVSPWIRKAFVPGGTNRPPSWADLFRGHSSAGRASVWQTEGQGFKSPWLHTQEQPRPETAGLFLTPHADTNGATTCRAEGDTASRRLPDRPQLHSQTPAARGNACGYPPSRPRSAPRHGLRALPRTRFALNAVLAVAPLRDRGGERPSTTAARLRLPRRARAGRAPGGHRARELARTARRPALMHHAAGPRTSALNTQLGRPSTRHSPWDRVTNTGCQIRPRRSRASCSRDRSGSVSARTRARTPLRQWINVSALRP